MFDNTVRYCAFGILRFVDFEISWGSGVWRSVAEKPTSKVIFVYRPVLLLH